MIDPSLRHRLSAARDVVVFTGAGMSADSGVPTFRDRCTGLWATTDPQEVATPQAFRTDPQRVWDWHVHLAEAVRCAAPNAGHRAVAALQQRVGRVTVLTQNIDNLHQAAGSQAVVELHGSLLRLKAFVDEEAAFAGDRSPVICHVCGAYAVWEHCDHYAVREDLADLGLVAGPVPSCPGCGALLRPDIVWFGEPLEPSNLMAAWEATERCDLLFCIGSSLEVEPAASLPWRALQRGALVVEVNPVPTRLSAHAHASISGTAAAVLPELFASIWGIAVR